MNSDDSYSESRQNKWDLRFLALAAHVASWSKDPSTQVGAVITDERHRIISLGFNGFPQQIADDERLDNREEKYRVVVHGEVNALIFAGHAVEGCTLYTHPFCSCPRCAVEFIQAGIGRVVYPDGAPSRWAAEVRRAESLFDEAGVQRRAVETDVLRVEFSHIMQWFTSQALAL